MTIKRVCVYCASSRQSHADYLQAANLTGRILAEHGITVVYGGGAVGSMGHLAQGAMEAGGKVIGIIPRFMQELEWGHSGLTELQIAADLHERKRWMMDGSDAVVALPGGSGTFEELFEAITWKRLGLYCNPIILVNTRGFFSGCVELLENCIQEKFMDERHRAMWTLVNEPKDIMEGIRTAPPWDASARSFAAI